MRAWKISRRLAARASGGEARRKDQGAAASWRAILDLPSEAPTEKDKVLIPVSKGDKQIGPSEGK